MVFVFFCLFWRNDSSSFKKEEEIVKIRRVNGTISVLTRTFISSWKTEKVFVNGRILY